MNSREIQKNGYKVLILDSDPYARAAVVTSLRREGFLVAEAGDAKRAFAMLEKNSPDMMIIDVALEGDNGFSLLEKIRLTNNIPIVVCTALTQEELRVQGLEAGADDYITKPFSPREFCVRVKAVLRRARNSSPQVSSTPTIEFGDVVIEPDVHEVRKDGLTIPTTAKEFELLYFMARSPGKVFSRSALLTAVWGIPADQRRETTVTEHMRRLRSKIETDPGSPRFLRTIRSEGYSLYLS